MLLTFNTGQKIWVVINGLCEITALHITIKGKMGGGQHDFGIHFLYKHDLMTMIKSDSKISSKYFNSSAKFFSN